MLANFLQEICLRAGTAPGQIALLGLRQEALNYREVWDEVQAVGRNLTRAGFTRADVVAAALPEGVDALCVCLGATGVAAFAPLNPVLQQADLEALLSDLRPAALIVSAEASAAAMAAAAALGVRVLDAKSLRVNAASADAGATDLVTPEIRGSDPAFLLHTSATTGRAKLVCLTHANFHAMAFNSIGALGLTASDRLLSLMPMFHLQGMQSALQQLMVGGSVVCATPDAGRIPEWLREFRPTWYTAGPALHSAIVSAMREQNGLARADSLRLVRSIGAPLAPGLLAELEDVLHVPVLEGYGLTETGAVTSNPLPPRVRKPGSAGVGIGPEIGILDEHGGISAGKGTGEIVVRGPSVFHGYRDDPEATSAAFHEGWFRTGDLGSFDGEGYLYVTGRIKEMINRGGEKILPAEIDRVLIQHGAVVDAAAFGLRHPTLGEDVAAAVVLRAGAQTTPTELRRFAASRLAEFKVPRRFLIVNAIPKSATGKPRRHALEELACNTPETSVGNGYRDEVEARIAECWAGILNTRSFGADDDFFSVGGDSLSAKLMLIRIEEEFGEAADEAEFLLNATIATLARLIRAGRRTPALTAGDDVSLFALQPRGSLRPLFFIPGVSGDPFYLRYLAARLGTGRPFYVLRGPQTDGARAANSVEEAAARFAALLRSSKADQPYLIAGHCYGGIVAFELARQLAESGKAVGLLILFDAPTPGYPKVIRNWRRYCRRALQASGKEALAHARFLFRLGQARLSARLPRAPRSAGAGASTPGPGPTELSILAARTYVPKKYPGEVHAFLAADEPRSTRVLEDSRLGWRDVATGGFDFWMIPGTHETMFQEPYVAVLEVQVARLLSQTGL